MDKISVIVPVWNAHDYLERCVDSILRQTYENLEILLVDDGSSDDSFEICQKYEKKDSRVRAFHKENGGQGSARNYALDCATGDFIGFVDNDDWIYPTMYERLHALMLEHDADIGRCDDMQGKEELSVSPEEAAILVIEAKEFFDLTYQDILGGHVTDRLFRRELIGSIRFPQSKTIEDMRFMRMLLPKVRREVSTNEKLFFYTIREDNTSMRYARNHINSYERAIEFSDRYEEALERYPQYCELLLKKAAYFSCSAMKTLLLNRELESQEYSNLLEFMRKYKKTIVSLNGLKLRFKMFILLVV